MKDILIRLLIILVASCTFLDALTVLEELEISKRSEIKSGCPELSKYNWSTVECFAAKKLGYGNLRGVCTEIWGCSNPGAPLYSTMVECKSACICYDQSKTDWGLCGVELGWVSTSNGCSSVSGCEDEDGGQILFKNPRECWSKCHGCIWSNDAEYRFGESFKNGCNSCTCNTDGNIICSKMKCNDPCSDLVGKLGNCEHNLEEWGVFNGRCQQLTGCSVPIGYQSFSSMETCQTQCPSKTDGCWAVGKYFQQGGSYKMDGCNNCVCSEGGKWMCTKKICKVFPSLHASVSNSVAKREVVSEPEISSDFNNLARKEELSNLEDSSDSSDASGFLVARAAYKIGLCSIAIIGVILLKLL